MRFQSALVLSTLTAGLAAAAPNNNRHASFHARRSAAVSNPNDVAWKNVARDTVDYKAATDKISQEEWKKIFAAKANGQPAPAPAAPAAPEAAAVAEPAQEQAQTSDAPAPAESYAASSPNTSGGDSDLFQLFGCTASTTKSDRIWEGDDAKTVMTFTNDGDDAIILCWEKHNMWTNGGVKNAAIVTQSIPAGEKLTLSFADGVSGACAIMVESTSKYGDQGWDISTLPKESLLEFTTGPHGVFDISREANMNGIVLSAAGSQCTSGVKNGKLSCVFGCKDGNACEATGTYALLAGAEAGNKHCEKGQDASNGGGDAGGCQFNPDGDHIQVTFSGDRNWPVDDFSAPQAAQPVY